MTNVRLNVLGAFRLIFDGNPCDGPQAKKARALLAYLSLKQGVQIPRDKLAALLWSRSDQSHARHSLSQALSKIHRGLLGGGASGLVLEPDSVTLPAASLTVDLLEFEKLSARGDMDSLMRASEIYRGGILEGIAINDPAFQLWLGTEQRRLDGVALKVLLDLAEKQRALGQHDAAIASAQRVLAISPLEEDGHRALIRVYAEQGRSDAALRQYQELATALRSELGASPEAKTVALQRSIVARRSAPPPSSQRRPQTEERADARPSLVVLPFSDFSDDADPLHLADGLGDDLTSDLSRISGLLVISRVTALTYKERRLPVPQICRRLRVRYAVEGSLNRIGNRVRINVRLVDGETGAQLWAERYERDIEESFLVQSEITGQIAAALRLELLRAEGQRVRLEPPTNVTAWSCAMRGWSELWNHVVCERSYRHAKQYIEKALDLDDSLALGWTALARLHYIDAFYPFGSGERIASFRRSLDAAYKAISLDPKSAEAHAELATALKSQRRYDEAMLHSETALRLNPNYEETYANFATLQKDMGLPEAGLNLFQKSLLIAPHLPTGGRREFFIALDSPDGRTA